MKKIGVITWVEDFLEEVWLVEAMQGGAEGSLTDNFREEKTRFSSSLANFSSSSNI